MRFLWTLSRLRYHRECIDDYRFRIAPEPRATHVLTWFPKIRLAWSRTQTYSCLDTQQSFSKSYGGKLCVALNPDVAVQCRPCWQYLLYHKVRRLSHHIAPTPLLFIAEEASALLFNSFDPVAQLRHPSCISLAEVFGNGLLHLAE